jgi:transcriptional regulator with XRE-family HTH domain
MTGEQLREARERLGETQAAFAARLGVDQSTIHRWETNGPPDRGPAKIAIESVLAGLPSDPQVTEAAE